MTAPPSLTAEDYRDVVETLLRLHERDPAFTVRGRDARLIYALGSLELEVRDTVSAAFLLLDSAHPDGSVPLARKAFEFAVVAQWVHALGRDLEAYFALSDRHWRGLEKGLTGAGFDLPADLADRYAVPPFEAPPETAVLRRFEQVGLSFDGGASLYLLYRQMSGSCHRRSPRRSGGSSRTRHDPMRFGSRRRSPTGTSPLYILAVSLLWVGAVVDQYVKYRPREGPLKQQAQRLGVPSLLTVRPTAATNPASSRQS